MLKLQVKTKGAVRKTKEKNPQLTIMKTYGRPTRRFAMANVRTHALTRKATLLAQRLARRRVNVKMKNLSISRSRPARKVRQNNSSHLLKLPLISKKGSFDKSQILKPQNKYFTFIFTNSVRKARRVDE